MGRMAYTETQCLYKGALYLYLTSVSEMACVYITGKHGTKKGKEFSSSAHSAYKLKKKKNTVFKLRWFVFYIIFRLTYSKPYSKFPPTSANSEPQAVQLQTSFAALTPSLITP